MVNLIFDFPIDLAAKGILGSLVLADSVPRVNECNGDFATEIARTSGR